MQSIDLMVFTGHSQIANWRPGPLQSMGHDWEPIRAFAVKQYQHLLKLEITETCILTKKQKKMLFPYGELTQRKIKLIELKCDPYSGWIHLISMHTEIKIQGWGELLSTNYTVRQDSVSPLLTKVTGAWMQWGLTDLRGGSWRCFCKRVVLH